MVIERRYLVGEVGAMGGGAADAMMLGCIGDEMLYSPSGAEMLSFLTCISANQGTGVAVIACIGNPDST